MTNCISISHLLLWKQVVELHKQCCFLAVSTPRTAYFTPCKTSLGFVIYTPTAPFPGLLSLRDCCDGEKKIHHISMHSIQINSPSRSQSVCFLQAAPKSLLWSSSLNTVIFRTQKASSSVHIILGLLPLCSLFLSLCLNLYKSLSNPSITSWPKSTCDFVLFLSLTFCIAEGCWCWSVGWSAVKESLTRM